MKQQYVVYKCNRFVSGPTYGYYQAIKNKQQRKPYRWLSEARHATKFDSKAEAAVVAAEHDDKYAPASVSQYDPATSRIVRR